jgi:hypothetical protein
MRKAFDWKRSRISMLEVEAVPQSCTTSTQREYRMCYMEQLLEQMCISLSPDWFEYCFIYEKFFACGEF